MTSLYISYTQHDDKMYHIPVKYDSTKCDNMAISCDSDNEMYDRRFFQICFMRTVA